MASTETQKQATIDGGLARLAGSQAADGNCCQSGPCAADTAAALLAFIELSYKPLGWNGPDYLTNVSKALDFLFLTAGTMAIPNDRGDGYNANISGSGNGNAAVNGKTYAQAIQDTVDMFANGQSNVNSAATGGNVNILDATQIGPGPDPNPTPEPATLSLLALAGLAAGRRRKTIWRHA
jgi:MYXO-CTERM domain-containing protein